MYQVLRGDLITLLTLFVCSLPVVFLLFFARKRLDTAGLRVESYVEQNKRAQYLLYAVMLAFVAVAYLASPIYYTHYSSGVAGDSFIHPMDTLSDYFVSRPKHFFNPFLPQAILKFCLNQKLVNPQDYSFKEAVFLINSLPTRVFASVGLFFMFFIFKNIIRVGFFRSFLSFMFLGVSFVYWLWGVYNNSIGMALGLQIIAIFLTLKAIESAKAKYYCSAAFVTGLVAFTHVGSIYFCAASALFVAGYQIGGIFKGKKKHLLNLGVYALTLGILGWIFCFLMCKTYRAHPLGAGAGFFKILNYLSDPNVGGSWAQTNSIGIFLNNIKENMITGATHIFGILVQLVWYEKIIVFFMFASITALFGSLAASLKNFSSNLKKPFIYGLILAGVLLVGYTVRYPGMHYYSAAVVSNIYLFLLLLFADKENKSRLRGVATFSLIILILCMFAYNGFSTKRVHWGKDLRSCSIYQKLDDLNKLSKGEDTYYLEYVEPFKDDSITNMRVHTYIVGYYYDKFSHIHWSWNPPDARELYSLMRKKKDALFFAGDSYLEYLLKEKDLNILVGQKTSIDGYNYYELTLVSFLE